MIISKTILITSFVISLSLLVKCENESSRIKSLHILSQIQSRFAITLIRSEVVNLANESQEVFFTAQLPQAAFISNFSMLIGKAVIYGNIKEKEKAKKEYELAVKAGKSAGLVAEKPRETNSFDISVNVAAGQSVIFNLTYQELLKRTHGVYKHVINIQPQQVTPISKVDQLVVDVSVNEQGEIMLLTVPKFGPKIGEKTNKELLDMSEHENCTINAVSTSSSSYAYINFVPARNESQMVSGQLVVLYDVKNVENEGHIEVMNGYFIHFFSPSGIPKGTKNVLFVLDKSGSMIGRKFRQTKDAMKTILGELDTKDRFNILTFNDKIEFYKHVSLQANEENVKKAIAYVDTLSAMGGTNIHDALKNALEMLSRDQQDSLASMIIFLTDGEATVGETNSDAIVNKITALNDVKQVVVHSLAFGNHADFQLVQRISASNKGLARKIYEDSDADLQLTGFYAEISSPLLTNVDFKYLNESVELDSLVQDNSYNLYDGGEIVVVGKLSDSVAQDPQIDEATSPLFTSEVSARSQNGPVLYKSGSSTIRCPSEFVSVEGDILVPCCIGHLCRPPVPPGTIAQPVRKPLLPASSLGGFIERVWAYQTIKKLLKTAELKSEEKVHLREKALQLSLQYKFVTELTSMVVVKPDENATVVEQEVGESSFRHQAISRASSNRMAGMRFGGGGRGGGGMYSTIRGSGFARPLMKQVHHTSSILHYSFTDTSGSSEELDSRIQFDPPPLPTAAKHGPCLHKVVIYLDLNSTSDQTCTKNFNYFYNFISGLSAKHPSSTIKLKLETVFGHIDVRSASYVGRRPAMDVVELARDACLNATHAESLSQELLAYFQLDPSYKNAVFIVGEEASAGILQLLETLKQNKHKIYIVNLTSNDSWKNRVPSDHYFTNDQTYKQLVNKMIC